MTSRLAVKNVNQIVKDFLIANNFDGLYERESSWGGCSCEVDDLFPCSCCDAYHCMPGYKRKIDPTIDFDVDPGIDWVIGPDK